MVRIGILRQATSPGKNRFPWLYHTLGHLFGRHHVGYYFVVYAYAKWIDDWIDRREVRPDEARRFLRLQQEVVLGMREPHGRAEILGAEWGRFLRTRTGRLLHAPWEELLATFERDATRRGVRLSQVELEARVQCLGIAAIEMCEYILETRGHVSPAFKRDAARIYVHLDMLLDLEEDSALGYPNIPLEVTGEAERRKWMAGQISDLRNAFERCTIEARGLHPWWFRILVTKMLRKRRRKFERLCSRPPVEVGG